MVIATAQRTVLERFSVGHPCGSWLADEYAPPSATGARRTAGS
ncbi:hypothetical protein ACFC0C_30680 [Streptomyces sp. NPDC056178]